MKKIIKNILLYSAALVLFVPVSFAECAILTSTGEKVTNLGDSLYSLLSSMENCPKDVFALRKQLKIHGLTIQTTMVANRGYHNPTLGSFSFFELVTGQLNTKTIQSGDFFFGHFTTVDEQDVLIADQGLSTEPRLMIEAFAWDLDKKGFNFYELIGDGRTNQWFYRGDSLDIYKDNVFLHRQSDPSNPQFGNRLRCSGCHGAGGPIMKEIDAPYNDWWTPARTLDFGGRLLGQDVLDFMDNLVSPKVLADSVILGMKRLEQTHMERSLQETLRPLFCPVEINLVSDTSPNEANNPVIKIPVGFFIDETLAAHAVDSVLISRQAYERALIDTKSHFPETTLLDADHAWLTPVKAKSDQLAIDNLIKTGVIDERFAYSVLSIDRTNPVFSQARCGLLRYIPNDASPHWQDVFIQTLQSSPDKHALTLAAELSDLSHNRKYYEQKAIAFLNDCKILWNNEENISNLFLLLLQRREELKASELSKNKRGQILEPGFRVIFPETAIDSVPGKWKLSESCEVVE